MSHLTRAVIAAAAVAAGAARLGAQGSAIAVMPVQGSVSMLTVSGVNLAVQIGRNGVVLVDAPPADVAPRLVAEIRKLTDKPIRYIVNTSADADHAGGNAAVVSAAVGREVRGAPMGALTGLGATLGRPAIIAHTNVLGRMSKTTPAPPAAALPTTEYFQPTMDFFNGEAIVLSHHQGHTDGDSLVFFRRSDVIVTGDVFTPGRYPSIDLQRGGSVQGLVRALTEILALAVPEAFAEGGTKVIPGHGRVAEETDVAEFRDMVVIVRDRVQDLIAKKMTLEQIKAAKPSRDYDAEYGASPADADRFVESIYRSLDGGEAGRRAVVKALALALAASFAVAATVAAQGPPGVPAGGGRAGGPPPTGKAGARVDFTGYWVSVVSEDWRWRMITPAKGDYANIPLNAAGRKIADGWDPAKDQAAGEACRAYAAAAIMREPGRLQITWQDDNTLKIETDAGMQTRLLRFISPNSPPPADAEPTWQGTSIARWEAPPRGLAGNTIPLGLGARAGTESRTLEVSTTRIRPGYLRKNGVPFSAGTTMTEYFDLFKDPDGLDWFVVTSIVRDPQFLNGPWVTTSHFKKEPDGSKWKPSPCAAK